MKVAKIDMAKVKDGNPFSTAVWVEATLEEEKKVYEILNKINSDKWPAK